MGKHTETPEQINVESLITTIEDIFSRKYSYQAIKEQEFHHALEELTANTKKIKTSDEFCDAVVHAFTLLNDGHIRIINKDGKEQNAYPGRVSKNFNSDVTNRYLSDIEENKPITVGKINDIAYICIDSFMNSHKKSFEWLYEKDPDMAKQFIIDLRANRGGNDSLGKGLVAAMLGNESTFISSYYRFRTDEEHPEKLTDFKPRYISSEATLDTQRKRVIVLTGKATYSSGEWITMDLAAIPGTLLIGDTTGGGVGCPKRYLLDGPEKGKMIQYNENPASHNATFAMDIPSWLGYRLDQILVQNNGINPHIKITPENSIVGNRDLVLEKALDVFKNGYIAR